MLRGMPEPEPPLVVDLDGTLIHGDSSGRACAWLLLLRPWLVPRVLGWWLGGGRARAKAGVFHLRPPELRHLRWRGAVCTFVRDQLAQGRRVVLATGSDRRCARLVAAHLGITAPLIASDGRINRIGPAKREALLAAFGRGGFDYLGDSGADLAVWAVCRRALVVGRRDPGVPCQRRFDG